MRTISTKKMRRMRRTSGSRAVFCMKRAAFLLLVALLAVAPAAVAQRGGNTRSVQGVVTDEGGAVVDQATVRLKDTKSLQIRSFVTRQDGTYHFHGLSPDIDYEVRAEKAGAESDTKTVSSFDSRRQATVNLKLKK
jgi:hypothetical protein